ncbi:MAG: hypothetical protein ACK4MR_14455, partial [Erythrobacter cryptus]
AAPEAAPAPAAPAAAPETMPTAEVAALLADRDARTAELEAAISELQAAGRAQPAGVGDGGDEEAEARLGTALARIEARLEEQEQSFRHVLTMLIEWLEDRPSREAA